MASTPVPDDRPAVSPVVHRPSGLPETEPPAPPQQLPPEIGGAAGPEPTRYGDWQHKGRVTDF